MPLAGQTIDVPLQTVDQISPTSSGPIGSIKRLLDAEVRKYQSSPGVLGQAPPAPHVRIEKREAFGTLSDVVRNSTTGAVIASAPLNNQTLFSEFHGESLLVSNDKTHVYSKTRAAWFKHDYQLPTFGLTQDFIHTSNSVASTPDMATAQRSCCYTWFTTGNFNTGGAAPTELQGVYFRVLDEGGTVLRADTLISTTDTRIKAVSDGAFFWIFSEKGDGTGSFTITLVDINGVTLSTATTAVSYASGDYWDITAASFGPVLAQAASTGVKFTKYSWNGSAISQTSVTDTGIAGKHKLGWLTNDVTANAILGTIDHIGASNNTVRAYRVPSALTSNHTYTVATSVVDEPANITGYVVNGSEDIVVAYGLIDSTGANYLVNTVFSYSVTFAGVATALQIDHAMSLASRAFKLGQSYYAVGYYPSNLAQVSATVTLPNQPTYFLIPLDSTSQRTAGRWNYGSAYADWQTPASPSNFALASVVLTSLGMRTALSYRAESFTTTALVVGRSGPDHFRPYNQTTQVTTVGVQAFTFGDPGEAVELADVLLIPGPGAASWSGGEFSEDGIALAFEQPTITAQTPGVGPLTAGTYQYVAVGEWTDTNGNRVRSRPSPPATFVADGSHFARLSGRMNNATTKRDLLISLYRTDMVSDGGGGFVPTTTHYKVTFDVTVGTNKPLYNDTLGTTWSYDDGLVGITANEILYTDKGQLENYPAPAFSRGTVWRNRAWLVGYDGAIWFSSESTPGDATWFHPAFRVQLPTTEQPLGVAALDDFLIIFCASSIWYLPASTLPDSAGQGGNIPTPIKLPFAGGGLGPAVATREGIAYAATEGGVWFITRGLENRWLSEPMADTLSGPVTSMTIDSRRRIYAVSGGTLAVYDTLARSWYEWSTPANIAFLGTTGGVVAYADQNLVWAQVAGTYCDNQFQGGVTTLHPYHHSGDLNFLHLGGIRNYKVTWKVQGVGDVYTMSTLQVQVAYDDNPTVVETRTYQRNVSGTTPLVFELLPAHTRCSSIKLAVTDASPGANDISARGWALEVLSFYVGLEKGLNRVPISTRT